MGGGWRGGGGKKSIQFAGAVNENCKLHGNDEIY